MLAILVKSQFIKELIFLFIAVVIWPEQAAYDVAWPSSSSPGSVPQRGTPRQHTSSDSLHFAAGPRSFWHDTHVLLAAHQPTVSSRSEHLQRCHIFSILAVEIGFYSRLTHWGRVTHICVGKLTNLGSDNGLSPGRRQAIIWTNVGITLIGPLGTNFREI